MDAIAGMDATHRRVQGPGFELVGLDGERGAHTAIWFGADSPLREAGLRVPDGARAFLERPGIAGLARLAAVDRVQGALVYATGRVWSVPELWAMWHRQNRVAGVRAALELAWGAAEVLAKAHAESAAMGVWCHGALDPWRLALRPDGQVVVLGYGVCPASAGRRLGDGGLDEVWRYAPPERVEDRREGPSCDVFGLALITLECMLGAPVYAGQGDALKEAAADASVDRRLYALRDHLPDEVRALLGRATRRDPDARFDTTAAFAEAVRIQLASPQVTGPSLRQLLADASLQPRTRFVGLDELRREAKKPEVEPEPETVLADRPRWVSLGGRRAGRSRDRMQAPAVQTVEEHVTPERGAPEPPSDVTVMIPRDALAPITEQVDLRSLKSEITNGERIVLRVRLPSGAEIVHAAPPEAPCGHVARDLADRVGLPTVDLLGRIRVTWVLSCGGHTVRGGARVESLDAEAVTLERVANRPVQVAIVVFSSGSEQRFDTKVGVAITARALVAHVRDKLDLGAGTGSVRVGTDVLGLDDLLVGRVKDGDVVEVAT